MSNVIVKGTARPSAAQVRAWGRENDFDGKTDLMVAADTRGRVNTALQVAFNAKRKGAAQYKPNTFAKGTTVTVKPAKGRAKTVKVDTKALRALALAQGLTTKTTGRIPKAVIAKVVLG